VELIRGAFYEFHKERVISRAGQPLKTKAGIEIGPRISDEKALRLVRTGNYVYTVGREDAYRLATQAASGKPVEETPHEPDEPSPKGRKDVYFRHYHPGGDHESYGHIFFGDRGEEYKPKEFKIVINRKYSFASGMVGELYANGKFVCYTLELAWFWNMKNKSCVPKGKYSAFIRHDHKDKWRIELIGVPGNREHVQIHMGNYPRDILGCVLVGTKYGPDSVWHSSEAYKKLQDAYRHVKSHITVEFEGILATPWGDYPGVQSNAA